MQYFDPQTILKNEFIELRPLAANDFDALFAIASDPLLWEQHPAKERSTREGFEKFFYEAMQTQRAFAIINQSNQQLIGTTRFNYSIDLNNAVEIGWTFLSRAYWGGKYNQLVKGLMLEYAFGYFEHVLFYIDKNNFRSQKAVEKLGGKRVTQINDTPITKRTNNTLVYALDKDDYTN
jgi:RimJ/RimL family protein N-acetyltransferase